jgi:hypothetical protein
MEVVYESEVPRIGRIDFLRVLAFACTASLGLTLSVASFIHSSKLASMGTLFIGVTALPLTCNPSSPSAGVLGLWVFIDRRLRIGVAASLIWFMCISCWACRECSRFAFSFRSSFSGILLPINLTASISGMVAHFTGVFAGVDTFPEKTRARGMAGNRVGYR